MISDSKNFNLSMKNGLKATLLASMIALAACGGGGDGYYGGGSSGNSGTGGNTGTDDTTTEAVNISNLELYDVNNTLTRTVTVAGATAKVKVTDAAGVGISGALVIFSGEGVTFGTSNGAVLTNADGEASISVKPADSNATGSYQLSATADYDGKTATTSPYNFSLQAANIVLSNMTAATNSLESGASTNITLKTQDAITNSNQNNVPVTFATSCGTFDNATVVSSNQGDVTTTYKAIDANGKLCEGTQTITATGTDASITKSLQVTIAAISANALVYTTANPVSMATKNSGSSSSGQIEFTVYANGTPAANQDVSISLVRGPSDLTFVTEGNRQVKILKSDSSGKVSVNLYPGALPGPVEIKATLVSNSNVFVLSKNVVVATGRAYQNGISISVSKNSLSADIDGDTATVTARMVDRVGNPVPDGTVISFVAEGGSIIPNCATTAGVCSVTLSTQSPRPIDDRVSVVAYVEGDKAYLDVNGDNIFTKGTDTLLNNIGDLFRDDNENNIYDPVLGEYVYRRGSNEDTCGRSSIGQPNISGTCDGNLDGVLRQQLLFAFASDTPTFFGLSGIDESMSTIMNDSFIFQIFGNTLKKVPMPSGTRVGVTVKDNTDFQPKATITQDKSNNLKTINVSGAEPNSIAFVMISGAEYSIKIGSAGNGTLTEKSVGDFGAGTPTVNYTNTTCEAEIVSGDLTVPDVVDLLTPSTFGLSSNTGVIYKVKTQKCAPGDDIRITVSAPHKNTTLNITR